eukprot:scpid18350/ scgid33185/ 
MARFGRYTPTVLMVCLTVISTPFLTTASPLLESGKLAEWANEAVVDVDQDNADSLEEANGNDLNLESLQDRQESVGDEEADTVQARNAEAFKPIQAMLKGTLRGILEMLMKKIDKQKRDPNSQDSVAQALSDVFADSDEDFAEDLQDDVQLHEKGDDDYVDLFAQMRDAPKTPATVPKFNLSSLFGAMVPGVLQPTGQKRFASEQYSTEVLDELMRSAGEALQDMFDFSDSDDVSDDSDKEESVEDDVTDESFDENAAGGRTGLSQQEHQRRVWKEIADQAAEKANRKTLPGTTMSRSPEADAESSAQPEDDEQAYSMSSDVTWNANNDDETNLDNHLWQTATQDDDNDVAVDSVSQRSPLFKILKRKANKIARIYRGKKNPKGKGKKIARALVRAAEYRRRLQAVDDARRALQVATLQSQAAIAAKNRAARRMQAAQREVFVKQAAERMASSSLAAAQSLAAAKLQFRRRSAIESQAADSATLEQDDLWDGLDMATTNSETDSDMATVLDSIEETTIALDGDAGRISADDEEFENAEYDSEEEEEYESSDQETGQRSPGLMKKMRKKIVKSLAKSATKAASKALVKAAVKKFAGRRASDDITAAEEFDNTDSALSDEDFDSFESDHSSAEDDEDSTASIEANTMGDLGWANAQDNEQEDADLDRREAGFFKSIFASAAEAATRKAQKKALKAQQKAMAKAAAKAYMKGKAGFMPLPIMAKRSELVNEDSEHTDSAEASHYDSTMGDTGLAEEYETNDFVPSKPIWRAPALPRVPPFWQRSPRRHRGGRTAMLGAILNMARVTVNNTIDYWQKKLAPTSMPEIFPAIKELLYGLLNTVVPQKRDASLSSAAQALAGQAMDNFVDSLMLRLPRRLRQQSIVRDVTLNLKAILRQAIKTQPSSRDLAVAMPVLRYLNHVASMQGAVGMARRSPLLNGPLLKTLLPSLVDAVSKLPFIRDNPMIKMFLPTLKQFVLNTVSGRSKKITGRSAGLLPPGLIKSLLPGLLDAFSNLPFIKNKPMVNLFRPIIEKYLLKAASGKGLWQTRGVGSSSSTGRPVWSRYTTPGAQRYLTLTTNYLLGVLRQTPGVRSNLFLQRYIDVMRQTLNDAIFNTSQSTPASELRRSRIGTFGKVSSPVRSYDPFKYRRSRRKRPGHVRRSPGRPWVQRKLIDICCKREFMERMGPCVSPRAPPDHAQNMLKGANHLANITHDLLSFMARTQTVGRLWLGEKAKQLCCSPHLGMVLTTEDCRKRAATRG